MKPLKVSNQSIQIKPWEENDLDLLFQINAPNMMKYLGGPESEEQILNRHERYLNLGEKGCMFSIRLLPQLESVGTVGYWETKWNNESVYETGWSVLPAHQGKGIAKEAVKLVIESASATNKHRYIHAFPKVDNDASNALCRSLNFQWLGVTPFEYPKGNHIRCNDWRFDLNALE